MRGFGRVNKVKYILGKLEGRNRILHIGCTNSPHTEARWDSDTLLHKTLYERAKSPGQELVGLDIDADAIELLRSRLPSAELIHGDAHDLRASLGDRKFDLIIAADVIEHLANPGQLLTSCAAQMAPGAELLITTSNAFGIARFAKSLLFHEAVHPDHTAYYSLKTLARLIRSSGLSVTIGGYYGAENLRTKFSVNRLISNALEWCTTLIWPQFAEGVVMTASAEGPSGRP